MRVRNRTAGESEIKYQNGPRGVAALFRRIGRPSERVIATRCPVIVDDLAAETSGELRDPLPIRSSISVPMLVNDELVGTLSIGAAEPHRFDRVDEHLLGIIGGQIGVAVQNARLHDVVSRGK